MGHSGCPQDTTRRACHISTFGGGPASSTGQLWKQAPTSCETQWADGPPFVLEEQKSTCQLNANLPFCCLSPQAMSILPNQMEQGLFFGSLAKHGTACSHTPQLSSPVKRAGLIPQTCGKEPLGSVIYQTVSWHRLVPKLHQGARE